MFAFRYFVFSLILLSPFLAVSQEILTYYKLKGISNLSTDSKIELAEWGEPLWYTTTRSGLSFRNIIHELCGDQDEETFNYIEAKTIKINYIKSIDTIIENNHTVAIPFCLKVEKNVPRMIRYGDTLEGILKENYSYHGNKSQNQVYDINVGNKESISFDEFSKNLPVDSEIVLPYVSEERIYRDRRDLKFLPGYPEISFNIPASPFIGLVDYQGKIQLSAEDENMIGDMYNQNFPTLDRINFISFETAESEANCIIGSDEKDFFIANSDLLKSRFEIEANILREIGGTLEPVTVGIIDSGVFKIGDEFFSKKFFKPNIKELNGVKNTEDNNNKYIDDIYGINLRSLNGRTEPFSTDLQKDHGTKIASIILGGKEMTPWLLSMSPPLFRIKLVNLSSRTPIPLSPLELTEGIAYLTKEPVGSNIINMSLSHRSVLEPILNIMKDKENTLFIVAAGNRKISLGGGENISNIEIFPARYGGKSGQLRKNVLTVGSHNRKQDWARFSNYSSEYVDLLANGCQINARDTSGDFIFENGTSVSAAIVSFAASLIRALGETKPEDIKNRLISSTDTNIHKLKDRTWSWGTLNIIKAISLSHDVIENNNDLSSLTFARIIDKNALSKFCGDKSTVKDLKNIRKITPNIQDQDTGGMIIYYWKEVDGFLQQIQCSQTLTEESIGKIKTENGTIDGPTLNKVKDIVFSVR